MNDEHQTYTLEKSELDDQALITGVLAGDLSLFTLLVTRHSERVNALALRLLGNKEEAEDVVHYRGQRRGYDREHPLTPPRMLTHFVPFTPL